MILWRCQSGGVPVTPFALQGWEPRPDVALVHRETDGGHVVGVGDPLIWQPPRRWEDVGDGWSVAMLPGDAKTFEPRHLTRLQGWADVGEAKDMHGRTWLAPVIRRLGGGRAFRVAYGRDWMPALTPEQVRAEEIVAAAQDATNQDTPMAVACQWAAELLGMSHHVTADAIAALALMDETLAVSVIRIATSLETEVAHGV